LQIINNTAIIHALVGFIVAAKFLVARKYSSKMFADRRLRRNGQNPLFILLRAAIKGVALFYLFIRAFQIASRAAEFQRGQQ
jgi:hypothetical protein